MDSNFARTKNALSIKFSFFREDEDDHMIVNKIPLPNRPCPNRARGLWNNINYFFTKYTGNFLENLPSYWVASLGRPWAGNLVCGLFCPR